ncbi:MAG: tryptophan-rich sensory protein [Acidobacteriota bacterium]
MLSPRQAIGLAVSIGICFGAAGLGSSLTTPSIDGWYAALLKPSWTPPNWVFGPVWSALYLAMAIAAWLVWNRAGFSGARVALALFAAQLVLNVCWSAIFFWAHRPGFAFGEIILLWVLILATTVAFRPLSRAAAWLMVPYLFWVAFAAALNYSIWRLNA